MCVLTVSGDMFECSASSSINHVNDQKQQWYDDFITIEKYHNINLFLYIQKKVVCCSIKRVNGYNDYNKI